jgi:hypothetical protein
MLSCLHHPTARAPARRERSALLAVIRNESILSTEIGMITKDFHQMS